MKYLLLLLAGAGAYFIYKNAKVNPQVTRLDGWERTAQERRPNMPSPAVGEVPPMYVEGDRLQSRRSEGSAN